MGSTERVAVCSCGQQPTLSDNLRADDGPCVHREIASVSISDVHEHRTELLARCFSSEERARLGDATDQTIAGLLAVKQAWVALASALIEGASPGDLSQCDVTVMHSPTGAPVIAGHNAPWLRTPLFISVSHTRTTAHGVICTQQ